MCANVATTSHSGGLGRRVDLLGVLGLPGDVSVQPCARDGNASSDQGLGGQDLQLGQHRQGYNAEPNHYLNMGYLWKDLHTWLKKRTDEKMMAMRLTTLQTPCETGLTRCSVLNANCTGMGTVRNSGRLHLQLGNPYLYDLSSDPHLVVQMVQEPNSQQVAIEPGGPDCRNRCVGTRHQRGALGQQRERDADDYRDQGGVSVQGGAAHGLGHGPVVCEEGRGWGRMNQR